MDEWKEQFNACQLIFYRATSGHKKVLFGSKGSVIDKNDERLRTIPFQTRRATFKEIKRVQDLLCRLEIVGQLDEVENLFPTKNSKQLEKSPKKKPHRSKSRDDPSRPLPVPECEDSEDENVKQYAMVTQEVSTSDLQEFDSSPAKSKGKRSKNKKGASIQKDIEDLDLESSDEDSIQDSLQIKLQNDLLTAVKSGNNQMLEQLLGSISATEDVSKVEDIVNHQFGEKKSSPLHIAAKDGHKSVIWTLLLHGADPTVRDKQKKVPYMMAETKDTRNMFRKFMGEFPEKYDYKTAMIPPPLSQEEEAEKQAKKIFGEKPFKLLQDNDVLDTWFSSALWPFSTLDWPNNKNDLERFYPTNVLVTGFDIIFFWVARMMMMSLEFTDKIPFKDVYVTGLIRDENGPQNTEQPRKAQVFFALPDPSLSAPLHRCL